VALAPSNVGGAGGVDLRQLGLLDCSCCWPGRSPPIGATLDLSDPETCGALAPRFLLGRGI
jgi:hypothetical protein